MYCEWFYLFAANQNVINERKKRFWIKLLNCVDSQPPTADRWAEGIPSGVVNKPIVCMCNLCAMQRKFVRTESETTNHHLVPISKRSDFNCSKMPFCETSSAAGETDHFVVFMPRPGQPTAWDQWSSSVQWQWYVVTECCYISLALMRAVRPPVSDDGRGEDVGRTWRWQWWIADRFYTS